MRAYFHQALYSSLSPVHPGSIEASSDHMIRFTRESVADICSRIIPEKVNQYGPHRFNWLEIHAHGEPGKILLGSDGVTSANVNDFGNALRSYLQPNGVIEVMACEVAGGKVKSSPRFEMQMDIKKMGMGVTDGMSKHDPRRAKYMNAVYETIFHDSSLRQQHAGMALCSQLATSSGCTVRAACWIQVEEDAKWSENMSKGERAFRRKRGFQPYSSGPAPVIPREAGDVDIKIFTEFGHWEGPVYEFLPGGGLNYLGDGLKRYTPYRVLHAGSKHRRLTAISWRIKGDQCLAKILDKIVKFVIPIVEK